MVIGMEKFSMKTGSVPSRPGNMKSNNDQSSLRLFCNGEPEIGAKLRLEVNI